MDNDKRRLAAIIVTCCNNNKLKIHSSSWKKSPLCVIVVYETLQIFFSTTTTSTGNNNNNNNNNNDSTDQQQQRRRHRCLQPKMMMMMMIQYILISLLFFIFLYCEIDILWYYLDPTDPPRSIKHGIKIVSIFLLFTVPILVGIFSAVEVLTIQQTIHRQQQETIIIIINKNNNNIDDDEESTTFIRCNNNNNHNNNYYNSKTLILLQWRRVYGFYMLRVLVTIIFFACVLWRLIFSAHRTSHLWSLILFVITVPTLCCTATSLTVPSIILENNELFTSIKRSIDLTCKNASSFFTVFTSFLLINALWIIPYTLVYIRGPITTYTALLLMMPITWSALSWNFILGIVLHQKLVSESYQSLPPSPSNNVVVSTTNDNNGINKKKLTSRIQNKKLQWKFIIFILLALGSCIHIFETFITLNYRKKETIIYNTARYDLSGAQCFEMLLFSAYAYNQNLTYGGACLSRKHKEFKINDTKSLLDGLEDTGVKEIFHFSCPPKGLRDPSIRWRFLPWMMGKKILSQEWRATIHSKIKYPEKPADVFKVVVHIRRGDISPCIGDKMHKFLPNQYYLDMIDKYMPISELPEHKHKKVEVIVHSQNRKQPEPLVQFHARNYSVYYEEAPLPDVWKDMMTADILIMSSSGFSNVPALLNRDAIKIVFPEYLFFDGAPGWDIIDYDTQRPYKKHSHAMTANCTPGYYKRFRPEKSGTMFIYKYLFTSQVVKYVTPN